MDISNFNVRVRPETQALATEKAMSLGPVEAYWYECLRNGNLGLLNSTNEEWPELVPKGQLFDEVRRRVSNLRMSNVALGIIFTRKLLPDGGGRDARIRGKVLWMDHQNNERVTMNTHAFCLPSLKKCRDWWVQRFGAPNEPWPESDVAPEELPKKESNLPF